MKKILLILCFIVFYNCVYAQNWHFGAEFGPNASWLNTSKSTTPDMKPGPAIMGIDLGIIEHYNFGNLAFRTGIGFNDTGGQFTEDGVFKTVRIFYFSVPLNLIYQQHQGKYGFFAGGGGYGSIGVGGGLNTHPKKKSQPSDIFIFKSSSAYRVPDAGAQGIFGYKLESGFEFNFVYSYGLTNIISKVGDPNNDRALNVRMLQLNVGYIF